MFGIGEVARRSGVRPSTVRYYEERGLIAPDDRRGGKRLYNEKAIERLLLIVHAKELGFSLDEIGQLLKNFPQTRWSKLASEKIAALEAMTRKIESIRHDLDRISRCNCSDVEACAHAIAAKRCR